MKFAVLAKKVAPGLYELRGVSHTRPPYRGAAVCGGNVFAERHPAVVDGEDTLPASWECFCEKCLDCDPNGWPTLRDCVRESPRFWMADAATADPVI